MTEQLSKIEENMLIIIDQYKEKVNLATSHEQLLAIYATVKERKISPKERKTNLQNQDENMQENKENIRKG